MAYSLIANTLAGASDSNSVTTAGINTSGADLIVLVVTTYDGDGPTPTDSNGNTWTALTLRGNANDAQCQIWYSYSPSVGSGHTFSVSTSTDFPSIGVLAFSGAAASPFDQQNGARSGAGTVQPGSVTPSEDNEVIVTGYGGYSQAISSINSGFTLANSHTFSSGQRLTTGTAYLIQTTAAAVNPTWTLAGTSENSAAIATFKAGVAAPDGQPAMRRGALSGLRPVELGREGAQICRMQVRRSGLLVPDRSLILPQPEMRSAL